MDRSCRSGTALRTCSRIEALWPRFKDVYSGTRVKDLAPFRR
jgi:hypothetical protein